MINPNDLPNFKAGDPLAAADLQKLRDAARQALLPGVFSMPGMTLQRPMGGDGEGSSGSNFVAYAEVLEEAEKDLGTPGSCILINTHFEPVDENGEVLDFDIHNPSTTAGEDEILDALKIEFYSPHKYAACKERARIWLTSKEPIVAGAASLSGATDPDGDNLIKGHLIDLEEQVRGRDDFGMEKVLFTSDGVDAASVVLDSIVCEEEEE